MSQCSEFYRHNTLCCFSTSVYCCKRIYRYRFSPETFGYTFVYAREASDRQVKKFCSEINICNELSRYSAGLRVDQGFTVRFPAGAENFSLHHRYVQNGSGAYPVPYPMCTRGSFPGVKRPGREADHTPPSSAEVKE
jgi:hypothetical protein